MDIGYPIEILVDYVLDRKTYTYTDASVDVHINGFVVYTKHFGNLSRYSFDEQELKNETLKEFCEKLNELLNPK